MGPRPIILVGLPGSGKTTAGRLLAARLGAPFVDVDRLIEARTGRTIERIFAEQGEDAFRTLEADIGRTVLAGPPAVIAPGAGFLENDERRREALEQGYVVFLEVSPTEAARRLEGHGNRPLLQGFDPVLKLAQILRRREGAYLQAAATVNTEKHTAEQVAERLAELARTDAGW